MKKKNGKKGVLILTLLLLLVVPILIAVFLLHQNQSDDLSKGSISSFTLIDGEKRETVKDEKEVEFFVSLAESGESISETVDPLSSYREFRMIFHKINNDVEYRFYLSDSAKNCVYTDANGDLFLIPEKKAEKLLAHSRIVGSAVTYAAVPTLEFVQGGEIYGAKKIEGEWTYINHSGKEETRELSEKAENTVILPQGENFDFKFSMKPEFCSVTLQNEKGELLYSGDPEDMKVVELETDTKLSMVVQCDWYKEKHETYYGSIAYSYDVFYDVPTLCSIDKKTASPGDVITITVEHASTETIEVVAYFTAGDIEKEKEDGVWTIQIPVAENASSGESEIVLMGKDVKETFKVTIR